MTSFINYYARAYGFIQVVYGNAPENTPEYVYYTDYPFSTYRKAALSIAKKYNIQKAVAIITSDFPGMDFTNNEGVEIVAQYVIIHSAPYEYILQLLAKEIINITLLIEACCNSRRTTFTPYRFILLPATSYHNL